MEDNVVVISRAGERSLPAELVRQVRERAAIDFVVRQHAPGPQETARLLSRATVLATTNVTLPALDDEVLRRLPDLRRVVLLATGHEHVDDELLARHGVGLVTLPAYATTAVAEHALGLVLTLATRAHLANDRSRGLVPTDTSLRGIELGGRTLGIIGVGRIGTHLARISHGIGMQVIGSDIDADACTVAGAAGLEMTSTDQLLTRSDVVAVCASTDRAHSTIVDARRVGLLREGAFLVNVGRPVLVDTGAVVAALRSRRLRGYGVDEVVLDPGGHADLLMEGRALQTGHSAWWRDEALERGATQFGQAILDCLTEVAEERAA